MENPENVFAQIQCFVLLGEWFFALLNHWTILKLKTKLKDNEKITLITDNK